MSTSGIDHAEDLSGCIFGICAITLEGGAHTTAELSVFRFTE